MERVKSYRSISHRSIAVVASRGFALVAVLWILALLTLLATAVVALSTSHRRLVAGYAESVQTNVILDSAFRATVLELMSSPRFGGGWRPGQTRTLSILGSDARVSLAREVGLIDLNAADEDLLFAFFAANGWEDSQAHLLSRRIVNWRSVGSDTSDAEATSTEYSARHAAFESTDELRQLPGAERISQDLLDDFTVYTHLRVPLASAAPTSVTAALVLADRRILGGHRWQDTSGVSSANPLEQAQVVGELLRMRICVTRGASTPCSEVIARLSGDVFRPVQVFSWHYY